MPRSQSRVRGREAATKNSRGAPCCRYTDQAEPPADSGLLGLLVRLDAGWHGFGDLCPGAQPGPEGIAAAIGLWRRPRHRLCRFDPVRPVPDRLGLSFLWGPIADRFGRTKCLAASILVFSVFTGAAALSQNVWQLALFRLLAGIGIGGEWAMAGTYVAEAWPEDRRKTGAGYLQTGYYAGFFLAAALNFTVGAHYGWRAMFLCGAGAGGGGLVYPDARQGAAALGAAAHADRRSRRWHDLPPEYLRPHHRQYRRWSPSPLSACGRAPSMNPPRC